VSYHLQALDSGETGAYINHRLKRAAIGAPLEFPPDVCNLIHQHSQGIPRCINVIADAVLFFAYGEEQHAITVGLTHDVLNELESMGVLYPSAGAPDTPRSSTPATIAPSMTPPATAPSMTPQAIAPSVTPPAAAPAVPVPPSPRGSGVDRFDNIAQRKRQAEPAVQPLARPASRIADNPLFSVRQPLAATSLATGLFGTGAATGSSAAAPRLSPSVSQMTPTPVAPRPIVRPQRQVMETRTVERSGLWGRIRRSLGILAGPAYEK
jgi:hypothetical protein